MSAPTETTVEDRDDGQLLAEMLMANSGWESASSLRFRREHGATVYDAHRVAINYGEEKWHMLIEAGYRLDEVLDVMWRGYWTDGNAIQDPYATNLNAWTRLFYYCGASLEQLRQMGFPGQISPEAEQEMITRRSQMRWQFS